MRSTKKMRITLSSELATAEKDKVTAGEYATENEVIREALRILFTRDRAMKECLCDQVIPAAVALKADPGRALSRDQIREHLMAKRQRKSANKP